MLWSSLGKWFRPAPKRRDRMTSPEVAVITKAMGRILIPVPLSQGLCDREHIAKSSPGSEVVCQRTKSPPASTSDPSGSAHH